MAASFQISHDIDFVYVNISGRIISDEGLNGCLEQLESTLNSGKYKAVVCVCSALEYTNSIGLNLFIRMLTRSRKQGIDCILVDLQPAIMRLFEISKLNEIFSCFPSLEEMKTKFND